MIQTKQILDEEEPRSFVQPEKNLVAAVLQRAVSDLYLEWNTQDPNGRAIKNQYHRKSVRLGKAAANRSARAWFWSTSESEFSFRWCCNMLGFSPAHFRRTLIRQILP